MKQHMRTIDLILVALLMVASMPMGDSADVCVPDELGVNWLAGKVVSTYDDGREPVGDATIELFARDDLTPSDRHGTHSTRRDIRISQHGGRAVRRTRVAGGVCHLRVSSAAHQERHHAKNSVDQPGSKWGETVRRRVGQGCF